MWSTVELDTGEQDEKDDKEETMAASSETVAIGAAKELPVELVDGEEARRGAMKEEEG